MKDNKTEVLAFRLTEEEKKQLEQLARKDSRTTANYLRLIISNHIKTNR